MKSVNTSEILFIYDFRLKSEAWKAFQEWAITKGMKYWEKQAGVLHYQTSRKQPQEVFQGSTDDLLAGDSKKINVFSSVKLKSRNCLETIINSDEFQSMQSELCHFIESNSLSYAILESAYDSRQ